jgi:membrane protein DedA with SNARE-associated domain
LALAGLLLSHHVIKSLPGLIAVYSGVLIADLILYAIGRKCGRRVATLRPFSRISSPERFARLEQTFLTKGAS